MLHREAEDFYIKVLRPLEVVALHGGMVDGQNFSARMAIGIGNYQLGAIAVRIVKIKIVRCFGGPVLLIGVHSDMARRQVSGNSLTLFKRHPVRLVDAGAGQ